MTCSTFGKSSILLFSNRISYFIILLLLATGCGVSKYEFLLNKNDEEIEVVVRPPVTKENYLKDRHRVIIMDTEWRLDSTTMTEYYRIQPEGWIYLGRRADEADIFSASISYLEVRTIEDTVKYIGKAAIRKKYHKRKFIDYTFENDKGKERHERKGGFTIIVK